MAIDPDAVRVVLETERADLASELGDLTAVTRDPAATIGFGKRVGEGTSQAIDRIEKVGQAGRARPRSSPTWSARSPSSTRAPTAPATGAGTRSPRAGSRPGPGRCCA